MPNVTATPRGHTNGQVLTEFIDSVGTSSVTYTYPTAQESLSIRNTGTKDITATVVGVSQTIRPGMKWERLTNFMSFDIISTSGVQSFEAVTDEAGTSFDTPEGRYIDSLGGATWLSVKSFGAKADNGITDNRAAIQATIDAAAYGTNVIFPYSANPYYISDDIKLKSGVTLLGCGSTIMIPSTSPSVKNTFYGGLGAGTIRDVSIIGFTIRGTANDKSRAPMNVQVRSGNSSGRIGIHINNGTNIRIEHITLNKLETGLKFDVGNSDYIINHITSSEVYMPIYFAQMTRFRGENWYLDCPLDASSLDHQIYMNEGLNDIKITNITALNGMGNGAINITNSGNSGLDTKDITLTNIRLHNVGGGGFYIAGGNVSAILIDHIFGSGSGADYGWFNVGAGNAGKVIQDITFSNFHFENTGGGIYSPYIVNGVRPNNVKLIHGRIKGKLGNMPALSVVGTDNFIAEDIEFEDATATTPVNILYAGSAAGNGFTAKIKNCTFNFPSGPNTVPISARTADSYTLIMEGNKFRNSGTTYDPGICNNFGGGVCLFRNNQYSGFNNIVYSESDTTTILDKNFNEVTKKIISPSDPVPGLIGDTYLKSVDGLVFKLSVSDGGVLSATTAATVYDFFDRADNAAAIGASNSGQTWVNMVGTFGIVGNEAYCVSDMDAHSARIPSTYPNVKITCDVKRQGTDSSNYSNPGIVIRCVNSSDYIFVRMDGSQISIARVVGGVSGGTLTQLPYTSLANTYYNMRIEVVNDTITVYMNDVALTPFKLNASDYATYGSATDLGIRLTKAGTTGATARWNNFIVYPL